MLEQLPEYDAATEILAQKQAMLSMIWGVGAESQWALNKADRGC